MLRIDVQLRLYKLRSAIGARNEPAFVKLTKGWPGRFGVNGRFSSVGCVFALSCLLPHVMLEFPSHSCLPECVVLFVLL